MSDFLGRLAARHADSAMPAITPRAVSRFEPPALSVVHAIAEPSLPTEARLPASRVLDSAVKSAERTISQIREPQFERTVREVTARPEPVEPVGPVQTRIEQILKHVETIVSAPSAAEPTREVGREPQIVATPVVPRIVNEPTPRQAVSARPAGNQPVADDSEPTVIRVHIGRIDVRASAGSGDRPRPRLKTADAPKPMSLDRSLCGKDRS
jgi:hypothetical protein